MPLPESSLKAGSKAPAFTLPLLGGGDISLDHFDKGAVLVFFKTECPTCQLTFPFVQRLYQRLQSSLGFLGIGQNEVDELEPFLAEHGANFPVALDADPYPVSKSYDLVSVPTFFLVDAGGTVRHTFTGHSKEHLEAFLQECAKLAGLTNLEPIFSDADAAVRDFQPG